MATTTGTPPDRRAVPVDIDPVRELFASSSVAVHLVRGIAGLLLTVAAFVLAPHSGWAMLLLVPAVVAWRGCPTCWTLGLSQTVCRTRPRA